MPFHSQSFDIFNCICDFQSTPAKGRSIPLCLPKGNLHSIDEASIQGKFGWHSVDSIAIPYLIRYNKKQFVSRKMADITLRKHLRCVFTSEVYDCVDIIHYPATKPEAVLLNEINHKHTDNEYGMEIFYDGARLIALNDFLEMLGFLTFCKNKIVQKDPSLEERVGFLSIGEMNYIAYISIHTKRYMPIFYFESESQFLKKGVLQYRVGTWHI